MRVLVTGHQGYIGQVMMAALKEEGIDATGVDTGWFRECTFGTPTNGAGLQGDVRDIAPEELRGFDAVFHLAALCNDPLGALNPGLTADINCRATVRLAEAAKQAGVPRFLFSSSCSIYGTAGDDFLDENSAVNPVTAYAESKVESERLLTALASDSFSPAYLRNATAYGLSPGLRLDLVLNDFVAAAVTGGQILIKSDGTPWRPIVHVSDICRAFIAVLRAPREAVHNQAFNVGLNSENYQVRELAEIVRGVVPGSEIVYEPGGGPDKRCYRVDCSKIARMVPGFQPAWTASRGAEQMYRAFQLGALPAEDYHGIRYKRVARVKWLLERDWLDADLRWSQRVAAA